MNKTQNMWKLAVVSLTIGILIFSPSLSAQQQRSKAQTIWGPQYSATGKQILVQHHPFKPGNNTSGRLRHWNEIAINASGLDHTDTHLFGQQLGPGRAARAMAIVHIAIFEALNAIDGKYESYVGLSAADKHASMECAIAQAAHDTLCEMFSAQIPIFDQLLNEELNDIADGESKSKGIQAGKDAAAAILALRSNDGSAYTEPLVGVDSITSNDAGRWRQDPISLSPVALGAQWGQVTPFVLRSANQFRTPPPPALNSAEYTQAYNEAKTLGIIRVRMP